MIMDANLNQIVNTYFENNAYKLHKIVDKILWKLNFHDVDHEDFYSLSHELFYKSLEDYDRSKSFDAFLYSCLYKKFCTEMTGTNRDKRSNNIKVEKKDEDGNIIKDETGNVVTEKIKIPDISFDTPVGDDDNTQLKDMISSKFNVESSLFSSCSENMENYINNLDEIQKNIAEMIGEGFNSSEIKGKLNLSDKEYSQQISVMKSYEKRKVFYEEESNDMEEESMNTGDLVANTTETYRNTSYSIESISKQLSKKQLRDDHILQRHSGQWKNFAKSELISDILRGKSLTQIIVSEEIKNNLRMKWLIDGKQRCTTLHDYLLDGFAIQKNVKNYNIRYQAAKLDENGNEILNEEGFAVMETKEFDIRGKKFSQLPEELQDIFKDRQIPVLYNENCTKKDIADDIARFNRSRSMNTAQLGWLGLDEEFAELVEKMTKMKFFQPNFKGSSYTDNNHTSSAIRRIIVESIFVSDFINEYSKDFEKKCTYLSEEASDSNFTEFYSYVERLTSVSNEDVADMFNAKNSFLWFGLFSRFDNYGLDDTKFIDFMKAFKESLHKKKINGISYEELEGKGTKDKNIVTKKMQHLEQLMNEYLHSDIEKANKEVDEEDSLNIVKYINPDVTEKDIQDYKEDLEILTLEVNNKSKLLDERNIPSLIAMIAYGYTKDEAIDEWFVDYFRRNNMYTLNQKRNLQLMIEDFNEFKKQKGAVA